MTGEWTCQVCLVSNDESDAVCCCCSSGRTKDSESDFKRNTTWAPIKKQKVNHYLDQPDRVRMKYLVDDLKTTVVFIVGSSEIEQIPEDCCDKRKGADGPESMYECSLPTPILSLPKIKVSSVSCGALHTALLTGAGVVYTFGCNDMGALGRSAEATNVSESEPFIVNIDHPVKKVTCGDNHTLFLTYGGNVFVTGGFKDTDGPIGMVDFDNTDTLTHLECLKTPVQVPCDVDGSTNIIDVCSGENHCVLLPQGGRGIYVFGSNEFNQLMIWNDDQIQIYTEDDVDFTNKKMKKLSLLWPQFRTLYDLRDGEQNGIEELVRRKRRRSSGDSIQGIYTGYCTTFIQTKNTLKVYGAGRNGQGEVGCNSDEQIVSRPREIQEFEGLEIKSLSGGQFFTMALMEDGLYTWGNIDYIGHNNDVIKQITPLKLEQFDDSLISFVFNGADTSFAVTSNNELYAWGSAQNFILGNGKDYLVQKTPILIPEEHLASCKIINGMGGSQHTVFLCSKRRKVNRTL